jgi:uncharacterized membrane protein YqjE
MSLGLFKSAQDLVTNALGLARTRLDLLSTEVQELLARLVLLMIASVAAILLGALALGFGAVAIVMAAPADYRVWVAAGLGLLFLAIALFIAWQVRRDAQQRPFAASIAELERDLAALKARE